MNNKKPVNVPGGPAMIFGRKNLAYQGKIVNNNARSIPKLGIIANDESYYDSNKRWDDWDTDLIKNINGDGIDDYDYDQKHISEIMDNDILRYHIDNGFIEKKRNDKLGLSVYKYTDKLTYYRQWDEATLQCRGIITDDEGTILARGFNKFFNHGELIQMGIGIDESKKCVVMPKMDGSLGIAFKHNGSWVVSAAGSLNAEQAKHATKIMNDKYPDTPYQPGKTMMMEIIYPDNKIVTDYGDMDDLVLLGGTDSNGQWIHPKDFSWSGPVATPEESTVGEVLRRPDPSDTSEGYIIRQEDGLMMKVKHPSYLTQHKANKVISERFVWKAMAEGKWDEYVSSKPDEFHGRIDELRKKIESKVDSLREQVDEWSSRVPVDGDRKERYQWINNNVPDHLKGIVGSKMLNDQDIEKKLMDMVSPTARKKKGKKKR